LGQAGKVYHIGGIRVKLYLYVLALPVLLGSLWALFPAALVACLFLARTNLEDRMLQAELHGYADYASQVRYRLLSGVW
jgi:protein-S-isoprenylcysteine O-methyltransferase Ste14